MKFKHLAAIAVAALLTTPLANAQANYPDKPIRLVVPFPAGGSIDMVARIVAPKLSANLGVPVLVDNRPGASGNIAFDFVAKSPKDGYTLLMGNTSLASNPHMFAKLSFSPLKDLAPIIRVADQPNVLIVNTKWPFKSVAELIAHAKANPGKLSFGTSGIGQPQDVAARLFMQMTGTDMLNVPYKGGAPALADLLGGQIDLMFETAPTAVPYAKSGKLRALAVTTEKRLDTLPDIPTLADAGVAGYKSVAWVGLIAPAGTPQPILLKLNAEMRSILATPEVSAQLAGNSLQIVGGSSADFTKFMETESNYFAKFVRDFQIVPQ
jgi:tripartite-type tricarboxylate transporter receptor subunit TctC